MKNITLQAQDLQKLIKHCFCHPCLQHFLRENDLQLVLRSHEGPDAREDRHEMGNMLEGWTLDHDTPGEWESH